MPIFELTPIDLTSHHWRASTYNKRVLIRSKNQERARVIAKLTFSIATPRDTSQPIAFDPWDQEDLVACHKVEDSGYEEDGDEAILEPADYNDEFLRTQT